MDDQIRRWGIAFRSHGHFRWFRMSMTLAATFAACLMAMQGLSDGFLKRNVYELTMHCLGFTALFHLYVAIIAIGTTNFGRDNSKIYSVDCIWFNGALSTLYWLSWFVMMKLV